MKYYATQIIFININKNKNKIVFNDLYSGVSNLLWPRIFYLYIINQQLKIILYTYYIVLYTYIFFFIKFHKSLL